MVRMSDLVRGAKPGAPASAPPAPPPASRAPSLPAAEGKPPEPPAQVRSAARVTLRQAPAAPVEAPPTSAETPTDAIALFDELQTVLEAVRDRVRSAQSP